MERPIASALWDGEVYTYEISYYLWLYVCPRPVYRSDYVSPIPSEIQETEFLDGPRKPTTGPRRKSFMEDLLGLVVVCLDRFSVSLNFFILGPST
jgi:hypothetical protein